MDNSITLSLQELISSGCLSESTFAFDHEVSDTPEIYNSISKDKLSSLNAVKVSLLLSKVFHDLYPSFHGPSLAKLDSSNVFIQAKCCAEVDLEPTTPDDAGGEPIGAPARAEGGAHRFSNRSIGVIDGEDSISSNSSFDAALDEIFADDHEAGQEDGSNGSDEIGCGGFRRSQRTEGTTSAVDATDMNRHSTGRALIPISDTVQFRAIDRSSMCKLHCTLVSLVIICEPLDNGSSPPPTQGVSSSAALQILGNLVHAVFSQRENPSTALQADDSLEANDDIIIASNAPRRSRPRRNENGSLFFRLSRSGRYPISICRLLSDMIDVGLDGKADAPFASVDEVIEDLQQMSLYPETFLHDPDNSFHSPSLLFGQRHYGRDAEVTKILEISTRLEQSASKSDGSEEGQTETVFISGIAGCGKTHMARRVGSFLCSLGWMVLEAKFDRCTEYESREVIFLVFDKLMSMFVDMKHRSNEKDMEFAAHAKEAISDAFDSASLSALADLIPSARTFLESAEGKKGSITSRTDMTHWQLIILISKLLSTILRLGRFIMICLNDLQWCDSNMLMLINEVLLSVSQHKKERQHLLFVGTYRQNEINVGHPLASRLLNLKRNTLISVTEMNLASLSRDDIGCMLMTEMGLPRRLIHGLADVVHKNTSGHAIFVVELLNLLLRESTIFYSPQRLRFDWDCDRVSAVKTGDNVAGLIISNLTSLQPSLFWTLCVISCFGFKSETSLLRLLHGSSLQPEGGFNLVSLVEKGFVELSGSVVSFSHDLIQQHVYEKMPIDQRQKLHMNIGTVLAARTTLDSMLPLQPVEARLEQHYICDGGGEQDENSPLSIISLSGIATSQINKAGPESISDRNQRIRFAGWNLHVSKQSAEKSSFRAALYYCKNGIRFLGLDPWLDEACQLSVQLHEGAAVASFAVGNVEDVAKYANAIIDSEKVDFEQSLVAHYMLIRSLETLGNYADTITRGLAVLRQLNFDIHAAPSPAVVAQTMIQTSSIASQYCDVIITRPNQAIHSTQRNIMKIIDSVAVACFLSVSPYLPLVACATVIYSLQRGIFHSEESASAIAIFGYFKVFLEGNLDEGKRWGDLVVAILGNSNARARIYLYGLLYFWYIPIKDSCHRLHETYTISMQCGDVDSAMYALCLDWRFQFYGGEKLSIVLSNYVEYMKSIMRYSKELAKQVVLRKINLNLLVGITDEDPFLVLEGTVCDKDDLLAHAKLKHNMQLIEACHLTDFLSAFWMGDFVKAMESFKLMAVLPSTKMPKFQAIYYYFYKGIVAYQLFREGNGAHFLEEGNEILSKVKSWHRSCNHVENKLLLLQAEYFASKCKRNSAKEKYDASIKSARDHGFVHEQGLAYECMGKYLSSIVEISEAMQCFKKAHVCYMQWGAYGKAKQIKIDHGLDTDDDNTNKGTTKRERDWMA